MADVVIAEVEVTEVDVEIPKLSTRIEWVEDWEEATCESRKLSIRDRQYYDNDQWTKEEIDALRKRGQPVLTKNRIARKINHILGEEIRKRIDPVAHPRTPQHEDSARAATDALRYVEEEQEFDRARSCVLKNALIEGFGGTLKELDEDGDGGFIHRLRHIEWDRLFYDPHSRNVMFDDARYVGVIEWMDIDDAVSAYPDSADVIKQSINKGSSFTSDSAEDTPRGWVDSKRKRIKVAEMFFKLGDDWFRSVFTECGDLAEPQRTAYLDEKQKHSVNPLVMVSCYVDRDGSRYGVVRSLISSQDEINKRSSKSLHLLSVRQVIAERDAVRDPQKFQEELAKPDGFAETEINALQEGRVQTSTTGDLAAGHIQLLQQAQMDIDMVGPSSSTVNDSPASISGRAFIARQQSASQELGTVFDNLKTWSMRVFALDWLCVRQFWPEEKWLRVTDDKEMTGYRFVALNRAMTRAQRFDEMLQKGATPKAALDAASGEFAPFVVSEANKIAQSMAQQQQAIAMQAQQMGQQMPPPQQPDPMQLVKMVPIMSEQITTNQADKMLVDIVIDDAPETSVLAQEEFATLTDLLPTIVQSRPDLAPVMAKLVVKASQMPNKRELLQVLEQGPDPQQAQQAQQASQMQQAMAKAGLDALSSKSQLQRAQALKAQTEARLMPQEKQAKAQKDQAQAISSATSAGEAMADQEMVQWQG